MAYEFRLPDLGEGIAEAEVRSWLVKEGDRVEEHQNVALLETDKAVIEVPTPRGGIVLKLMRGEGESLRVGEVLMSLEEAPVSAAAAAAIAAAAPPTARSTPAAEAATGSVVGRLPETEETPPLATPGVRALARERGIPLAGLKGSGPRGSITREDLEAVKQGETSGKDQFGEVERVPLSAMRRAIAARLRTARSSAAYVTVMSEVDVTELWALRARKAEELSARGIRLSFMPFIMKALALALPRHPSLNAEVDEDRSIIVQKRYVNLGIAVDGLEGLLVPVVRDVQRKSIVELAEELPRLAERARKRELAPGELKGGSFAISNFGSFGGRFATPIPNYPDVAILGCGAIEDRPWVVGGALAIRSVLPLSLTFDHRASDGGDATRFLSELGRYLGDPANLIIEGR